MIFEQKSVEAGEETMWISGRAFQAREQHKGGAEQSESGGECWAVRSEEGVERCVSGPPGSG